MSTEQKPSQLNIGDEVSVDDHDSTAGSVDGPVALTDSRYQIHLPNFDGPLDLLLHLIRKEELDIFDISVSRLTAAYLDTLSLMKRTGIEPASNFLLMAATLMQLKSKLLLPKPESDDEELGDEIDPRLELMNQLLAYQAFKEAAQHLDSEIRLGREVFIRPPGQDKPREEDPDLTNHDVYRLATAFRDLLKKESYQAPHEIYVERITIGERIAQIADKLAALGQVSFAHLVENTSTREEVITTFLALLEMARLKLIGVEQRGPNTPLYIQSSVDKIAQRGEVAAGMLAE
ncbi:MAG: segregation/condensation protein A [Myxococcota bacterium]|nr:segregation/condensation protein A [Myxococcota bacterium]